MIIPTLTEFEETLLGISKEARAVAQGIYNEAKAKGETGPDNVRVD